MRKWLIFICIVVGALIFNELFFLYIINKYNQKVTTIHEQEDARVKNIQATLPECNEVAPKSIMNATALSYVESVESYVTETNSAKKKLFSTLMYEGTIESISFPNKDTVTINIVGENGKRIEQYLNFPAQGFRLYKQLDNGSLIPAKITELREKNRISVREIEEVLKNSMKLQDMTGYIEIIVLSSLK